MSLKFASSKTYPHSAGLSCAFRQWRAKSHCRFLHGYAFEIRVDFEAKYLDETNWAVDFGSLKPFKAWLEKMFDHKTLVAEDDPEIEWFRDGAARGVLDIMIIPASGCERVAEMVFTEAESWLRTIDPVGRCRVARVEVREHAGNSATVTRE